MYVPSHETSDVWIMMKNLNESFRIPSNNNAGQLVQYIRTLAELHHDEIQCATLSRFCMWHSNFDFVIRLRIHLST